MLTDGPSVAILHGVWGCTCQIRMTAERLASGIRAPFLNAGYRHKIDAAVLAKGRCDYWRISADAPVGQTLIAALPALGGWPGHSAGRARKARRRRRLHHSVHVDETFTAADVWMP